MINTVQQALEDVYVALGGNEDIDRLTVSQVLAKIYNVLGGTGDHGEETVPQLIDLIATVAPSGGGGGGASFPTIDNTDETLTCDMTYAEAYALYEDVGLRHTMPFMKAFDGTPATWSIGEWYDGEDFTYSLAPGYDPSMPETVTEGFTLDFTENGAGIVFGNDGNIYVASGK